MATIFLYDSIGWAGISAKDFANTLQQLQAAGEMKFVLRINSPGGSVFDGFAIYNLVRELDCTVIVDGLAGSIASVIALAGRKVVMNRSSMFMIHNPWTMAAGDKNEFEKVGRTLDMIGNEIAKIYQDRTGKTFEEVKAWMDAEKWFTSEEAKDAGFADDLQDSADDKQFVAMYVVNDVSHNGKEGKRMNAQVLAFLGLAANATDEQVNARVAELKAKAGLAADATIEQLLAKLTTTDAPAQGDNAAVAALAAQVQALAASVNNLTQQQQAEAVNALVDGAIAAGKILPADRELMLAAAKADFAATKAALDAKKANSKLPGTFDVNGEAGNADKLSDIERAALYMKAQRGAK